MCLDLQSEMSVLRTGSETLSNFKEILVVINLVSLKEQQIKY